MAETVHRGTALRIQADLPAHWTFADLQERLGGISAGRIRMFPPPGCATEEDVLAIRQREGRLCELEDGILVEKGMGWYESMLAALIVTRINNFLQAHDLGKVFGADGTLSIAPGIVKIPDIAFISWDRWPKGPLPRRPIPAIVPDLVIEVLSETNTAAEMDAKRQSYFRAGVRHVWYIDPAARSAIEYRSEVAAMPIGPEGVLDGGDVLPGFRLPLREIFDEADRRGPREP